MKWACDEIGQQDGKKNLLNLVFYCFNFIPKCLNCQKNNVSLVLEYLVCYDRFK